MSDNTFFGSTEEQIQKLANEVADLKGVLQDLSQQVRRIERRINSVLPERKQRRESKEVRGASMAGHPPKIDKLEAIQIVKKFQERLEKGESTDSIKSELRSMTVKDGLEPIARELGMTNTALPAKTELIMNIITRIRQSLMLTENIRKMPRVAEKLEQFGEK